MKELIDYARAKGANIINASWGDGGFNSTALFDAIAAARGAGIIFVAAAPNHNSDNDRNPIYPANFSLDNIVVVAATTARTGLLRRPRLVVRLRPSRAFGMLPD